MNNKHFGLLLGILLMVAALAFPAYSITQDDMIIGSHVYGNSIIVYSQNTDEGNFIEAECQIGAERPTELNVSRVCEDKNSIETIVLLDNSLSVKEEYRGIIDEVINTLIDSKIKNEGITLITFSDRMNYLTENSYDTDELKEAVKHIEYYNQETYLTDVLCELLKTFSSNDNDVFRRIIIVSDGVDNKAIGYTKDELNSLIKDNLCPMFTIGCTYGNNAEQLKNMFALSRMTGGKAFLLDDVADSKEITGEVLKTNNCLRIEVIPDEKLQDGSTKAVKLSFKTANGNVEKVFETRMPFAAFDGSDTDVTETKAESVENYIFETEATDADAVLESNKEDEDIIRTVVVTGKQEEQKKDVSKKENEGFDIITLIAVIIMLICIVAVIVILVKKKSRRTEETSVEENNKEKRKKRTAKKAKEKKSFFRKSESDRMQYRPIEETYENRKTERLDEEDDLRTERVSDDDDCKTERAGEPFGNSRILILKDIHNSARRYETEMYAPVIIGRSQECRIRIDDRSVSRRHCRIVASDAMVTVENLSESNGTQLNGVSISEICEVKNGDKITLGNIELEIELR